MNDLSCVVRMWAKLSFALAQSTRLTDRRLSDGYTVRCIMQSHRKIQCHMYVFVLQRMYVLFLFIVKLLACVRSLLFFAAFVANTVTIDGQILFCNKLRRPHNINKR